MKEKKVLSNKEKTREMTILAMFIAIIALLGLVPAPWGTTWGFFRIVGTVEATIIHIPVLIGAALMGKRFGIYLGLAFGIISNIAAFIYGSPLFYYPWVAILPRFIFGFLIVYFVDFALKLFSSKSIAIFVSFFILSLVHTIITLSLLYTVFPMVLELPYNKETFEYFIFTWIFLIGFPWIQLLEAAAAGLIGSVIVLRLAKDFGIKKYMTNSDLNNIDTTTQD
ncbi:MAG: ECF transporter S component [Candidatus Izimaplasma sp.]|nr:ECF transporter S component [Candidatus Izimaplasma bacterium]